MRDVDIPKRGLGLADVVKATVWLDDARDFWSKALPCRYGPFQLFRALCPQRALAMISLRVAGDENGASKLRTSIDRPSLLLSLT